MEEYVRADGFLICVQTNCVPAMTYLREKEREFARLTIHFAPEALDRNPELTFSYEDGLPMEVSFVPEARVLTLRCPWKQISESTILPMMFRLMVEWLRQKKGEIKFHASAVERGGVAALFLAPSEGGKTTTALGMCRQYRCFLRANDAAVVKLAGNIPLLIRGDTEFKVRYNGLEAYSPQLFSQKVGKDQSVELPWYSKLHLSPEDMGINVSTRAVPLQLIFFVRLDPLVDGVQMTEYPADLKARREQWFKPNMMVLQNIAGTIRGVDLIPIGNDGTLLPLVLPSMDTQEFSRHRTMLVNTLFSTCRAFQLRGQLEPMLARIDELLSQEEQQQGERRYGTGI